MTDQSERDRILSEIRRTAAENGGLPLGKRAFERVTGIREADYLGKLWAKWSDAISEAGFAPNQLKQPYAREYLLRAYASLVRELGHVPTRPELRLKDRRDTSFPSSNTFLRLGRTQREIVSAVRGFCRASPEFQDVLQWLPPEGEGTIGPTVATSDGDGLPASPVRACNELTG